MYIWDTAGQEKHGAITNNYYRNCHGVVLVYDVTKQDTFDNINYWLDQIEEKAGTPEISLVGNKSDLNHLRTVSFAVGEKLANKKNLKFYETSALDASNVHAVFDELAERINNQTKNDILEDSKENRDEHRKSSKNKLNNSNQSVRLSVHEPPEGARSR